MPFACVHENAWVTPERVVLLPDDLAVVVDVVRDAARTAERAEVDHPVRLRPRERVRLARAGGAAADDLAVAFTAFA